MTSLVKNMSDTEETDRINIKNLMDNSVKIINIPNLIKSTAFSLSEKKESILKPNELKTIQHPTNRIILNKVTLNSLPANKIVLNKNLTNKTSLNSNPVILNKNSLQKVLLINNNNNPKVLMANGKPIQILNINNKLFPNNLQNVAKLSMPISKNNIPLPKLTLIKSDSQNSTGVSTTVTNSAPKISVGSIIPVTSPVSSIDKIVSEQTTVIKNKGPPRVIKFSNSLLNTELDDNSKVITINNATMNEKKSFDNIRIITKSHQESHQSKPKLVFEPMKVRVGEKKLYKRSPKSPDRDLSNNSSTKNASNNGSIKISLTQKEHYEEVKNDRMSKNRAIHEIHCSSQVLKSKLVPLIGHACTTTIIEHLSMAYSRCYESHLTAVKDLTQYVNNFIKYKKHKEGDKVKEDKRNSETQTVPMQTNSVSVQVETDAEKKNRILNKKMETDSLRENKNFVPRDDDDDFYLKSKLYNAWNNSTVPDHMGNMPIHDAVLKNDFGAVQRQCLILKRKCECSVNLQNETFGMTALHLGLMHNATRQIIEYLLANGADPMIQDMNGDNCVHMAVRYSDVNTLQLILNKSNWSSFDLNITNYNGNTPLMLCAEYDKVDIATYLLSKFANPNIPNSKSGRTVLFQAIEKNNAKLVDLLVNCGADPRKKDYNGISSQEAVHEFEWVADDIRRVMYRFISEKIVAQQRKRLRENDSDESDSVPREKIWQAKREKITPLVRCKQKIF